MAQLTTLLPRRNLRTLIFSCLCFCSMLVRSAAIHQIHNVKLAHTRKLLSCLAADTPMYKPLDANNQPTTTGSLPLCTTQHVKSGGSWVPVTINVANTMYQARSADLASAWHADPINP